ncbi:fibronectin type III domain-containing protein [Methylibium sp.]|uniref:fibronectin type III domain-containing protein n=1 Tax=Methylibium sp. TaxID=2067992 RepID=UPI0017B1471A|nr:fibronectin type III domain-containing protein [Methylibium sp.]MBA3588314.1 fibronectin type III domain-containing protein [Methylibium sp.]
MNFTIPIAAASAAVFFCAHSSAQISVTPGPVDLYTGTSRTSSHVDLARCVAAAKEAGAGVYGCRNITRVVVAPLAIPPPPPPPPVDTREWRKLTDDGKGFLWASPFAARYGAQGKFVEKALGPGNYVCNAATFGADPAPGIAKQCDRLVSGPVTPPPVTPPPVLPPVVEPPPASSAAPQAPASGPLPIGPTSSAPQPGSIKLSWVPPHTNTDGSPLTDLAGYVIKYGTQPGNALYTIRAHYPSIDTYVLGPLPDGTYYLTVAAVNKAGMVGPPSEEVTKTIPSDEIQPRHPGDTRVPTLP